MGVTTVLFGVVHRGVGTLDQRFRILTIVGKNTDADTDTDTQMVFRDDLRLRQYRRDPFRVPHRILNAYAVSDRILIDVEDNCGGLPAGDMKKMFKPFMQGSKDKTGLGLGLSIARLSVEANAGMVTVRNIPSTGCVFTIDLPRHSLSQHTSAPIAFWRFHPPRRAHGTIGLNAALIFLHDL